MEQGKEKRKGSKAPVKYRLSHERKVRCLLLTLIQVLQSIDKSNRLI